MSLAPNYTPTTGFATDETNQVSGRSTVKTVSLDTEFANVSSAVNAINTNLKKLQRDDGKLLDGVLEPYALSEQTRALVATRGNVRGAWASGITYYIGDLVQDGPVPYLCFTAHTSGITFSATGFWIAISGDGQSLVYATQAGVSATSAAASALSATNSAASATNSQTAAGNSATSATASALSATNSASSAGTSAINSTSLYSNFNVRYLGSLPAEPAVDNSGNPLTTGALYFNTVTQKMYVWGGTIWVTAGGGGAVGSGGNSVFFENDNTVTSSYTITAGKNAITAGPVTISDGITVTIPTGSTWSII